MKNKEEASNERTILRIASCFLGEEGEGEKGRERWGERAHQVREIAPPGGTIYPGKLWHYPRKDSLGYMYPRRDKNQRPFKTRDNVRRTTLLFQGASLDRSYLRIVLDIH